MEVHENFKKFSRDVLRQKFAYAIKHIIEISEAQRKAKAAQQDTQFIVRDGKVVQIQVTDDWRHLVVPEYPMLVLAVRKHAYNWGNKYGVAVSHPRVHITDPTEEDAIFHMQRWLRQFNNQAVYIVRLSSYGKHPKRHDFEVWIQRMLQYCKLYETRWTQWTPQS